MLVLSLEKEHQPPCQSSIEASIKQFRLLNRFANDGYAGQVALECRDEGGCGIHPEDPKAFVDQDRRNGKARPAAQINDAAAAG